MRERVFEEPVENASGVLDRLPPHLQRSVAYPKVDQLTCVISQPVFNPFLLDIPGTESLYEMFSLWIIFIFIIIIARMG